MPTIDFNIKYGKNSNLVISPKELRDTYLFGIQIKGQDGSELDDETYKFHLLSAQNEIEELLNIKLKRQVIDETLQFTGDDFLRWGYIKTTYLIECPLSLEGFFNTTKQVVYPKSWLSVKGTNDGKNYHRNLHIVPSGNGAAHSEALTISGIVPQVGYLGWRNIPNYWKVKYVTGFKTIPTDILNAVGKIAAISMLNIAGDLILNPGIASQSLSIDGLSQSQSKSTGYKTRIDQYQKEVDKLISQLKDYYLGFSFSVM